MVNHRIGLLTIIVAVAVAGIIVGYAFAGLTDSPPIVTQAQSPDTMPILQAIATSVAPGEPTVTPTPLLVETLPVCDDAKPGDLCAPVLADFRVCQQGDFFWPLQYVVPCYKEHKP
jgi:hypothetical protein